MSVAIRTSQNVLLEYEPASIGERILAALIDYLVIFGWILLVFGIPGSAGLRMSSFYSILVMIPVVFYELAE